MGTIVQITTLLCVCVILYLSGGQSEELYPDLRCYPGYREELYDNEYVKSVHDQCDTEEKRKTIRLQSWRNFPQYDTYRGCIMAVYWYATPYIRNGKFEVEFRDDNFYATSLDVLVRSSFRDAHERAGDPEYDYRFLMLDRLILMGEKVLHDCNKTAEEANRKPNEEPTALYDCIDDIMVCKNGKAWIHTVKNSTLGLGD